MPLNLEDIINKLTIGQMKELLAMLPDAMRHVSSFTVAKQENTPAMLNPGSKVFIRTVTWHFTGEVVSVTPREIELKNAAWVADSKRFANFLKDGPAQDAEIEPYPDGVIINREVVIDISPWKHSLPLDQR